MKLSELISKTDFKLLSGDGNKEIQGCYIGDLLSLAMSKVQKDNIWITIQSNINIIAVASLTEAGCIVVCEGFSVDDTVLKRAESEDITVLTSSMSEYEIAKILVNNNIWWR